MINLIRIIAFIILVSLFGLFINNYGQAKFSDVVITVDTTNVVELKAKLYGKFDDLSGKNKTQALAYIDSFYDAGFWVENFRVLDWDSPSKPIGVINKLRINEGERDTIVYSTTLTNLPDTHIIVRAKFSPKLSAYVFRFTGNESIGSRLQDDICEPYSTQLDKSNLTVNVGDTVTLTASVQMYDDCKDPIPYDWEFRRDTSSVDTVIAYDDWVNWTESRNGSLEITDNYIKFIVQNNSWDNRLWRCNKSTRFKISID